MRLTTVGTGTAAPSPTRVCAAHLVEVGGVRLLLDCGSGSVYRMAALGLDWMHVTHLALTHFHPDHTTDLPTLIQAWRYGDLPPRSAPVDVYGPPGTQELLDNFARLYGGGMREPGFPLRVHEVAPGGRVELAQGTTMSSRKVPHTPESVAYCVEAGARKIVYTGDTGFDAGLGDWAAGCDVLLAECSLPASLAVESHLTPEQCGALAARARPGLLALTHFYPPVERADIRGLVRERFDGAVALAADGWTYDLGDG